MVVMVVVVVLLVVVVVVVVVAVVVVDRLVHRVHRSGEPVQDGDTVQLRKSMILSTFAILPHQSQVGEAQAHILPTVQRGPWRDGDDVDVQGKCAVIELRNGIESGVTETEKDDPSALLRLSESIPHF
jgi:hypothetical protein